MNLEPKAKAFLAALKAANLRPLDAGSPDDARATMKAVRKTARPRPLSRVENLHVGGPAGNLTARLYAATAAPRACLVYFHGGGWVLGSVDDSDVFARELAAATACAVVSIDYRLAPEAPFPAALEDAAAALRWIMARRRELVGSDVPIALIGDSAGANLATVLANSEEGRHAVAFQILAYPVTDSRMSTASFQEFAESTQLTASAMAWFWQHYIKDPAARLDPRASPALTRSLAGAPAAFVLTAENDPLRDEGEEYAAKMQRDGVPVLFKRYEGQLHGFLTLVGIFDGGAVALADIAAFIDEQLCARIEAAG